MGIFARSRDAVLPFLLRRSILLFNKFRRVSIDVFPSPGVFPHRAEIFATSLRSLRALPWGFFLSSGRFRVRDSFPDDLANVSSSKKQLQRARVSSFTPLLFARVIYLSFFFSPATRLSFINLLITQGSCFRGDRSFASAAFELTRLARSRVSRVTIDLLPTIILDRETLRELDRI